MRRPRLGSGCVRHKSAIFLSKALRLDKRRLTQSEGVAEDGLIARQRPGSGQFPGIVALKCVSKACHSFWCKLRRQTRAALALALCGVGGVALRQGRWHSDSAWRRRAAGTLASGSPILLANQTAPANATNGCRSAIVGKAKAKFEGQSKPLAKTRSRRLSGTRASARISFSLSLFMRPPVQEHNSGAMQSGV